MTRKMIILVGPSGSGKSTHACALVQNAPDDFISVNRDKIRELLFGYTESTISEYYKRPDLNKREKEVTQYENLLIKEALASSKTPIIDATHLKREYLERFKYFNCVVNLEFFNISLERCLEYNKRRTRQVGEEIIKKQYSQFQNLKKSLQENPIDFTLKFIENNPQKPKCIIFDIDGTLAEKGKRNPFNWGKVFEDKPIDSIVDIAYVYDQFKDKISDDCHIIFCSGRDEVCRVDTLYWLYRYCVTNHTIDLYMRKSEDNRPDWQVKAEMWEEICKKYYIQFMVDDRNQVVDYARNLGFKVLQTEYNNF